MQAINLKRFSIHQLLRTLIEYILYLWLKLLRLQISFAIYSIYQGSISILLMKRYIILPDLYPFPIYKYRLIGLSNMLFYPPISYTKYINNQQTNRIWVKWNRAFQVVSFQRFQTLDTVFCDGSWVVCLIKVTAYYASKPMIFSRKVLQFKSSKFDLII